MNISNEWNKIVSNAISVLVATVIVGAGGIVWERASAAREEIRELRDENRKMIELFSQKHADHDVQISTISNQVTVLVNNQTKLIQQAKDNKPLPESTFVNPKLAIPDPEKTALRTKVLGNEMIQQFSIPRK